MAGATGAGPHPWVLASDTQRMMRAERRLAAVRAAIIVFNSLVYHFALPHEGTYEVAAYSVIVLANVYGLAVLVLRPYRYIPALLSSYTTTLLDAAFISAWLFVTGGVYSPFHALWLVSVTAVAVRYGPTETIFAAVVYIASYAGLVGVLDQFQGNEHLLLVRSGYIAFTAALGALLSRDSAEERQSREAVETMAVALRESEERQRRMADAAFEGLGIHEDGRLLECNQAFANVFGRRVEECVGRDAFDFVAPETHALVRQRLTYKSDDPYEVVGLRADGTRFPMEVMGRDLPYDGRMVRVTAVRDLSERRRAESAVSEQRRLQEIDRIKTQFINNAAHELATPLTPIKLQSHLLKLEALGPLNEKQQKAVGVVARNVDQLSLLLKDVLDSARVQGGHIRLSRAPMDVRRILADSVESFHETAQRQGVEFALDAPDDVRVDADAARVTQVLFNLLSNALKFTPQGGRIVVQAARGGDGVVVRVHDSGAGINAEDIAKLFQPFSQVHDPNRTSRSGTGLGLYISRGIVEQHGGRIWCESEGPGRGTTFSFTLPASA